MKSIVRLVVIMLVMIPAISFAQTGKSAEWPELTAFHSLMAKTFHPAEDGNFAPLKDKADSLLNAAMKWFSSAIPDNYKATETKAELKKLVVQCNNIAGAVKANADDMKLKVLITDAHEIFHKIAGECKKPNN